MGNRIINNIYLWLVCLKQSNQAYDESDEDTKTVSKTAKLGSWHYTSFLKKDEEKVKTL